MSRPPPWKDGYDNSCQEEDECGWGASNSQSEPGPSDQAFSDWTKDYSQPPRYLQRNQIQQNPYSSYCYSNSSQTSSCHQQPSCSANSLGYAPYLDNLNRSQRQQQEQKGITVEPKRNTQPMIRPPEVNNKTTPPIVFSTPANREEVVEVMSKNRKKKEKQKRKKNRSKTPPTKPLVPSQVFMDYDEFWGVSDGGGDTDHNTPSTSSPSKNAQEDQIYVDENPPILKDLDTWRDSEDDIADVHPGDQGSWASDSTVEGEEEFRDDIVDPQVLEEYRKAETSLEPSTSSVADLPASDNSWTESQEDQDENRDLPEDSEDEFRDDIAIPEVVKMYEDAMRENGVESTQLFFPIPEPAKEDPVKEEEEDGIKYFHFPARGKFPGLTGPILPAQKPKEPEPVPEPVLENLFERMELQSSAKQVSSPEPTPSSSKARSSETDGSPWSTPIPTRHNLPPPAGPGSLWKVENSLAKSQEPKMAPRRQTSSVSPEQLARLRQQEEQRNVFTPFYFDRKDRSRIQKCPKNYRFSDCISFAALSHTWNSNWDNDLPILPRADGLVIPLPEGYPEDDTVFAYYRVLVEKDQKYILIACHVNLHGYHRGDLRFLEINNRTELEGFDGKNVIGNLFLGDIVAVTELARNSSARFARMEDPVSSVSQDTPCYWMVSRMQLFPRYQTCPVTFTFLKNRMAVVKGDDEPMRVMVENWNTVKPDRIYIGVSFKPNKLDLNFTEDFGKNKKNQVQSKALRISSYPNAFGTIYGYKECTDQNEHFAIGIHAFANSDLPMEKREKIVETCSLMGFSAANTIFNGRFDCRAFHMQDVTKSNLTVKFRIENPLAQPTLGLWNAGNRISFGGPEGDVNATIETVIAENEDSLRINARISRDIPKGIDFRNGEYFVSQRESTDHYFLYDGYFQDLDRDSNGRKIIETLYGGKPLELIRHEGIQPQYYFPSTSEVLALNQYQNEYVQMLLDGNPLIIGSSPFGCGKSMTIITAALEIYKRNCAVDILANQRQQLLITQSNYASVNLIEIAKRICSSGDMSLSSLKFVRFVTEKNWNELPDNCRTEYDMPYLMNMIFCEWATGRIDESDRRLKRLQNNHLNHMLAYILKNQLLQPSELAGGGRRVYDRSGDYKAPFSGIITEAFFILYQPDLIMTTADSSKNLLSVLKEVCTVQIDEASQLPEYTLLGLLKTFNRANFGLIGDIQQLPPYCEDTLDGKLKEYGIGNTMERAIKGRLFPISILRYVYRCHPRITGLLSDLFYDGKLLSGVKEHQRNEFILNRADFWPNNFPFMIINNDGPSFKMGTSVANDSEKELIVKMIQNLLHNPKYALKPHDIGVISFYAAQTSILTESLRGTGIKCGTVDAFQGTEREVIIVCCTNEYVSEFMQLSNRLNVAMSRAKQATIIVGNVEGLRRARYWNTIVQKVVENLNLVQAKDWKAPPTHVPHHVTAAQTAQVYAGPQQKKKWRKPRKVESPQLPRWDENSYTYRAPGRHY